MTTRANIYTRFGLVLAGVLAFGALLSVAIGQTKPVQLESPKVARLDVARGTAWVDTGTLTACAIGPQAHATARQGAAVAAVKGSTAVAWAPARAAGAPGTTITLLGQRSDGTAAGITLAPGRTAQAWTWYTLTDAGTFRVVGAMTEKEKAAYIAAGKGQ